MRGGRGRSGSRAGTMCDRACYYRQFWLQQLSRFLLLCAVGLVATVSFRWVRAAPNIGPTISARQSALSPCLLCVGVRRHWGMRRLFAWHPTLMSFAVLFLLQEAIRSYLKPSYKVPARGVSQCTRRASASAAPVFPPGQATHACQSAVAHSGEDVVRTASGWFAYHDTLVRLERTATPHCACAGAPPPGAFCGHGR